MEFKKLAWFYEILVNGEKVGSVQKNRNKWEATGKDNWIYTGNTRKEAAENLINQNR